MRKLFLLGCVFFGLQGLASETVKGLHKDYEAFKKEMSEKVDLMDKKIDELKTHVGQKGHKIKSETVKEYETTRDELRGEIEKIEEGSKSNWKKVKKHISDSADSLNSKLQESLKD